MPQLILKPKKESSIRYGHPWIFSGAIDRVEAEQGDVVRVFSSDGAFLGMATYNAHGSIAARILDRAEIAIDADWFAQKIGVADARRKLMGFGLKTPTTGYRVVFGESDEIPGLVVDRFEQTVVFQIGTAGLDRLREEIIAAIEKTLKPKVIVERSDLPSRTEERLEPVETIHKGKDPGALEFQENGMQFYAHPVTGQKTGFFCDQKGLRLAVRNLAKGREVLNLFSYSGTAGVAAMLGGAKSVHHVDASAEALAMVEAHGQLHAFTKKQWTTEQADIFPWISEAREPAYGMVLVDPPALIKSRRDGEAGAKAYHFLNRAALRLVHDGGIFISSSCSHFFSEEELRETLQRASIQSNVHLSVLEVIRQTPDHPLSVYFPEAGYLKTFVCQVKR